MEQIILEMSKKLDEKDKIIEETSKQTSVQDTFKKLKARQLLGLAPIDTKAANSISSLGSINISNLTKVETNVFSPTASKRVNEVKSKAAAPTVLTVKQKSSGGILSQSSSVQNLSESST